MVKNVMVTVGIPVYNAEKFLALSIQSVLNQTLIDFELLITDDGSTDRSVEIAGSFQDTRIKIIRDNQNRGISFRLNQQVKLARGKYFCRMDADDIMFPDRLKKQIDFLESHPEVDAVGSQAIVIDENNRILGIRISGMPETEKTFLNRNPFIHPTVTGKTEWFRENAYESEFDGAEDYELWMRTFYKSKFEVIAEPLLFYRDPLKLNIKSYRFRINRQIKMFRLHKENIGFKLMDIRFFQTKSFLKIIVYRLFRLAGLETFILKRRNKPLPNDDYNKYEKLLKVNIAVN